MFSAEEIVLQHKALSYKVDVYFLKHSIRINPDKENFDVFFEIGRIQNFIAELNKKSLVDELSNKLLGLEFRSNNSIKTSCLKYVVKKILPTL